MKLDVEKLTTKQIWNAVKLLLIAAAIIAVGLFIYYLGTEFPDWLGGMLSYPLVIVALCNPKSWDNGSLLLILLAITTYFAMICIPCREKCAALRRYFLRPAAAVLALLLMANPARAWMNKAEDRVYHLARAPLYHEIQQRIEEAEAAVCSDGGSHATQVMAEYLPQFTYKGTKFYDDGSPVYYVRSVILFDYDVPAISFCYRNDGEYCIKTLKLVPCVAPPEQYDKVDVIKLRGEGHSLNIYGVKSNRNGRTYDVASMMLSMIDGRKYILEDPIDPQTGEPYDLPGLLNVVNEYTWFENFKEKQ